LTRVDSDSDLYAASHVITKAVPEIIANGFGPWGFGGRFATVPTYTQGTLIVDSYDAGTRMMVWRAVWQPIR
jgi:hypothetical protein